MLGERLKELRNNRHLSQAKLAALMNITETSINNYESGRRKPAPGILLRLSELFGVASEYLLGMTDDPTRQTSLPHDWEQAVAWARSQGMSPDDVRLAVKLLKLYQTEKQEG